MKIRSYFIIILITFFLGTAICEAAEISGKGTLNPRDGVSESNTIMNLSNAELLKLNDEYELAVRSVDIDGNKAYVELSKDGQIVDSKVIVAAREVDDTFVFSKPGMAQKIVVHFKNAFRGADLSLATIDSILQ